MALEIFFLTVVVPVTILQLPVAPSIGAISIGLTLGAKALLLIAAAVTAWKAARQP